MTNNSKVTTVARIHQVDILVIETVRKQRLDNQLTLF